MLWTSLGISAVVHLVVLWLYPALVRDIRPEDAAFAPPEFVPSPRDMEVVRLMDLDVVEPEEPEHPEEIDDTPPPEVEPGAPPVDEPLGRPALVRPPPSAAERLRPRLLDGRLWAPVSPARRALTMEQREELELAARLEAWQDSVDAALAAGEAARDWTVTDGQGRKWGISPGELHLGPVTLPLPAFDMYQGMRDEVAQTTWEWEEIQRQGGQAAVRDSWKERAQAIRARRDALRRAQEPDTTRSR